MQFQLDQYQINIKQTTRRGSIALKVTPQEIALMVPKGLCQETLSTLIDSQQTWLLEKIREQSARLPDQQALNTKTSLKLFGEGIRFQLDEQTVVERITHEFLEGQGLKVFIHAKRVPKDLDTTIRKQLMAFFSGQLENYLDKKLAGFAAKIDVKPTEITIKNYKSRWGSCYSDGRIQFNWRLAMMPEWIVDYIIIHELCHLVHPNHSKDYWQLVATHCSDVAKAKAWLKQHGQALMSI